MPGPGGLDALSALLRDEFWRGVLLGFLSGVVGCWLFPGAGVRGHDAAVLAGEIVAAQLRHTAGGGQGPDAVRTRRVWVPDRAREAGHGVPRDEGVGGGASKAAAGRVRGGAHYQAGAHFGAGAGVDQRGAHRTPRRARTAFPRAPACHCIRCLRDVLQAGTGADPCQARAPFTGGTAARGGKNATGRADDGQSAGKCWQQGGEYSWCVLSTVALSCLPSGVEEERDSLVYAEAHAYVVCVQAHLLEQGQCVGGRVHEPLVVADNCWRQADALRLGAGGSARARGGIARGAQTRDWARTEEFVWCVVFAGGGCRSRLVASRQPCCP